MKKNAKKGLRKGRGSRNTLKIEDIEAVFAERKPGAEGNFKFFSVLVKKKMISTYYMKSGRKTWSVSQARYVFREENWSLSRLQRNALCVKPGRKSAYRRSRSA